MNERHQGGHLRSDSDAVRTPDQMQELRDISLSCHTLPRVNFACAQNDVAIVEQLTVNNPTDEALTDVRITLRAVPPIIREKTWNVERIASGSELSVRDLSTPLDIERLEGLNEAEIGELEFRVEAQGLRTINEKVRIELLARDEWGGVRDMAQILAAFVSPNDPAVAGLLKECARLLEAAGHDGSINGYQSRDPRRVYMLVAGIWSAATGLGLTYAEPPTSFEQVGQKVRDPGRIVKEGLATCLDSTLFLAAAYEAAGLHPVVLFFQDHASVGVWLHRTDFGHVTEPDVLAVRKAVQAHELIPIETTLLTKRPAIRFDQAADEGRRRLSEDRESEFVMAVDIARSRAARIRPLASHRVPDQSESPEVDEVAPAALPPSPDFGLLIEEISEETPDNPTDRIKRWQRKLLDLSLRNRLLNFRDSKQTLPLRCSDAGALEDALAAGKKFRGLPLSDEDPIGNRSVSPEEKQRIEEEAIRNAFENRQVVVPLTKQEMDNRFLTLYRRAKSDFQEGGTNTLFLAVGFLRWKKTEGDMRTYRAPLLLVPVKIERTSAQSAFKIAHHEDDVHINSTLIEFLKRDFDLRIPELEGELPRDESGIDVRFVFEVMRRKVRDVQGFEIVEDLALSTFSFAKYLMWKDLVDRTDQLRTNRLVKHLIDGADETYADSKNNAPIEPKDLDRHRRPRDLLIPLPADSSQLAAVLAASEGRDFILIGPPGTGKSQTIANMIAQCMAEGKTVLFVAEKSAALDVVHRRLVASGLGDVVLDLHSNKTDRKSVIAQLGRGWDRASGSTDAQWIEKTDDLQRSRDRLNDYVRALHEKGSQGFSVFDALGRVASDDDATFKLSFASKDAHDEKSYRRLRAIATELRESHAQVGAGPAFTLVGGKEWSLQWEGAILGAAEALHEAHKSLKSTEHALAQALGLRSDLDLEVSRRARLNALASRVKPDALDLSSLPEEPIERLVAAAEAFAADVRELAAAKSETVGSYQLEEVQRMDLERLDADWREAHTKIWPASAFARRKIRKLLQTYADNDAVDPARDLKALFKMRDRDAAIRESPVVSVGQTTTGLDANRAAQVVCQAKEFRRAIADLRSEVEDPVRFESATSQLASAVGDGIVDALKTYLEAEAVVGEKTRVFTQRGGVVSEGLNITNLDAGLETLMAKRVRLQDWTIWLKARHAACAAGLSGLVEKLETGCLQEPAEAAFERAYAAWWLPQAIDASTHLRTFTRWRHENVITAFRKLDDDVSALASIEVMRRIAHGLPSRHDVPKKSELGGLRHQLRLTRPSVSIRTLLKSLPEMFGKLAPCVLMSPLSIAQYLPAEQTAFDVVIFDEASQITTWDAIGAIARARQTVIVGDPKQLPPTNFFGRADDDDEDLPEVERDLLSILDEVQEAGVRPYHLRWHYRSRDEALIAFSNHHYYGDRLVTFPAPASGCQALRFHHIAGTYARGRGRTNQKEAEAIVAMVKQRLTCWLAVPEEERHTLGVITFNAEQQSLILDLLDEMRRGDARFEWFFADEREEPLIVKNLESIQGDERDVMLFSVTFGPDAAGKLTMNFGAINGTGGEKRLNVAITRARRELHVFSSIRSEKIDLGRTRAVGVQHLKNFLDYAERGPIALPSRDEGSLGPAENPFEEAVADALRSHGWEVRTQIGVSGFRVDLGVVHPDRAGDYIAGVECDGARYHSSATARDRDKLRQAVLEDLGWTILRVWSSEWFRDSTGVSERVHTALEDLLRKDREARTAIIDPELAAAFVEYISKGVVYQIYRGTRKAKQIAELMIDEYGIDHFKQYMQHSFRGVYNQVRTRPEIEQWADEMTPRENVRQELLEAIAEAEAEQSAQTEAVQAEAESDDEEDAMRVNVISAAVDAAERAEGTVGIEETDGAEMVSSETQGAGSYPAADSNDDVGTGAPTGWGEPERQYETNADRSASDAGGSAGVAHDGVTADAGRFFEGDYTPTLRRIILGIVESEGPMPLHGLARRVAQAHGWQRTGERIQERVRNNLGAVEEHTEAATTFVWAPGSHANRIPFRGLNGRDIHDISRAEIASVIDAHETQLSEAEDPVLALSRLLGIMRLRKKGRTCLSECILWRKEEEQAIEPVTFNWNNRYERSKTRLVQRLEALARHADPGDCEKAKQLIAGVQCLPEFRGMCGTLRIENRVAKRLGDCDFVYQLDLSDHGFQLSYVELMLYDERIPCSRDYTSYLELVNCGWDNDDSSRDEEELAAMREEVEMMFGPLDDDEWERQVEAASEGSSVKIPNGLEDWLEMLPVGNDGEVPKTVIVEWEG